MIVIDNLSTGKKENLNPRAVFHCLDICDFEKIRPLFKDAAMVFHLAALPRMMVSVKKPIETSRANILGSVSVFKAAAEAGVKRVVYAASSSAYGQQKELPLHEALKPNPQNPYGLQKLTAEYFARLFTNLYKTPIISLRYFNVYGPGADIDSEYSLVIGKFLKLKSQNKPLTLYGDGEQTRAFTYIDDVVRATILASQSQKLKGGEVINIGSEDSQSINYLAELIGGEKEYLPPRPGDILHTQADITKAKELLGWRPEVSFEEGVKRTQHWFKSFSSVNEV